MNRTILDDLRKWKLNSTRKKPLVLKGARQVGKTWALLKFGKSDYERKGYRCHYIDFRKSRKLDSIFQETSDPAQIIELLEFRLREDIDTHNDLLIFDEIQECPHAITSLKYFEQDMRELDLIAAGSHMGLMKNQETFPVGKVNFLYMFPMNFSEFVLAADREAFRTLDSFAFEAPFPTVVHERLLELHTLYSFTGGLPEVIAVFLRKWPDDLRKGALEARAVQTELVEGYRADFSKYSGVVNANHINCVFDAIPTQLSKAHEEEVRKFRFQDAIPNRKGFASIRSPLSWLIESRLCIKNAIAKKGMHPLMSYCDDNRFKAFLFDIGILSCMLQIPSEVILDQQLGPFKGFMLENFVAQELFSKTNGQLTSWQEGTAELEFLIACGASIVPVEVKSAARHRRSKSLDAFIDRYKPARAIKLSRQNLSDNPKRRIITVPIYCSYKVPSWSTDP